MLPFGLQLLHGQDRNLLAGSPTLYVVTDVFSGMVTGFYASMEATGFSQAMMALASCASDKQRMARRHGRMLTPQEWPCAHLPERLLLPPELMLRANSDALLANFHVRCVADYETPDRPWLSFLRSCFGAAADGAGLGKLDGVLTLSEFRRIVMDRLLAYNRTAGAGVHAPLQLWNGRASARGVAQAVPGRPGALLPAARQRGMGDGRRHLRAGELLQLPARRA